MFRIRSIVLVALPLFLAAHVVSAGQVHLLSAPCRVLDTRALGAPVTALTFAVRGNPGPGAAQGGQSGCGIPTVAEGAIVNVIAVNPTAAGHGKLWPEGEPEPAASTINHPALETTNDGLTVRLSPWVGAAYDLAWKGSAAAHLVVDLVGWIAPDLDLLVGRANGLLLTPPGSPVVLVVETLDGDQVKVFAAGSSGDQIFDNWPAGASAAIDSCVLIPGLWFNGVPPFGHATFEARAMPLELPGVCIK